MKIKSSSVAIKDILPFDPEENLQDEWLNSRGAIARFQRDAIEIRVLDIQECPKADFAVITAIVSVLRSLVHETVPYPLQKTLDERRGEAIFIKTSREGLEADISDAHYLSCLGLGAGNYKVRELWQKLLAAVPPELDVNRPFKTELQHILQHGNLAARIVKQLGPKPTVRAIEDCYRSLGQCLQANVPFLI
jgi:carboxylate-amine ligase